MPSLCDDVLLVIFAHLELDELYKVAQCSRRFQALAQDAFSAAFEGRLVLADGHPLSGPPGPLRLKRQQMLCIFGPFAKHIEQRRTEIVWPLDVRYFHVQQLQSMTLDVSQVETLCQQPIRFQQLAHLCLMRCTHNDRPIIDFGQCFPNLRHLKLTKYVRLDSVESQLPSGLHSLQLHHRGIVRFKPLLCLNSVLRELTLWYPPMHVNDIIDLMANCGIRSTLELLVIRTDKYCTQLTESLTKFERLKSFKLLCSGAQQSDVCTVANSALFRQLPNLERLAITGRMGHLSSLDLNGFIEAFAHHSWPKLVEFIFYAEQLNHFEWNDWNLFAAAMRPISCLRFYLN